MCKNAKILLAFFDEAVIKKKIFFFKGMFFMRPYFKTDIRAFEEVMVIVSLWHSEPFLRVRW